MEELPKNHPEVQRIFENGFHSVRRSDKFWAGLSTDLIIEQTLKRSVKISGGMTRGRGIDELQRSILWLLSTPVKAVVNRAMQQFTVVKYQLSDQHMDVSKSRIQRDHQDGQKLFQFFLERNPFKIHPDLINLNSGTVVRYQKSLLTYIKLSQ